MTSLVLDTVNDLEKEGINAEIISLNTIKPLDKDTILKSVRKTNKAIVVENHNIIGGAYSAVSELLSKEYPVIMLPIGIEDEFGQTGKFKELLSAYHLDSESISKKIIKFMKEN